MVRAEDDLSRSLLQSRGRDDVAQAGATADADLDGGRPSERGAPLGQARRWLDGLGRLVDCPFWPVGGDPQGSPRASRARSSGFSDLETRLHGGKPAPPSGAWRAPPPVLDRL